MPASSPVQPGIAFPRTAKGARSSSPVAARAVAQALRALGANDLAQAAEAERNWRSRYPSYLRPLVELALPQPVAALNSARAGLASLWDSMVWIGEDAVERSLAAAIASPEGWPLATLTLKGDGPPEVQAWGVPYQGKFLQGDELLQQLLRWVEHGIVESSAAKALGRCVRHPEWFDLSDRHIALLGAGSEAGPLDWLVKWRANLLAVDIDRSATWTRIADRVGQGNATLHLPMRGASGSDWTQQAGADLLRDAPRIAAWLRGFERPLDVGAFAYLDGERHLRVSMAMDMVMTGLLSAQPSSSLAYLATPTDVFVVPERTARFAQQCYANRPTLTRLMQAPLQWVAGESLFHPNIERLVPAADGTPCGVVDSLVLQQGPNYALAKRLQQWRAMDARARGHRVSLNIAPSTTTASVIKSPALAAGFGGASAFGMEVFEPATTNALMAALWVHDLRTDCAPSDPQVPLTHPFDLLTDQSCHGGLWVSAYRPRSALPFAAALGFARKVFRR